MHFLQACDYSLTLAPADLSGVSGTLITPLDTTKGTQAAFIVLIGNLAADASALKVQESDSGSGSWTDVTGGAWTAPLAASGDNKVYVWLGDKVNGAWTKRYLQVLATGGAGATLLGCAGIVGTAPMIGAPTGTAQTLIQ